MSNSRLSSSIGMSLQHVEETEVDQLPHDLKRMVYDYFDEPAEDNPPIATFINKYSFFVNCQRLRQQRTAELAANCITTHDIAELERIVEQSPDILSLVVETRDHIGRRIKGTLLQIAAMVGDFNVHTPQIPEDQQGIVERLCARLPQEEIARQLQHLHSPEWHAATAMRRQKIELALDVFILDIINAEAVDHAELLVECQASIEMFKKTFIPDAEEVIMTGYVCDPQILCFAVDLLRQNLDEFSNEGRIFLAHGYGFIQRCLSGCDVHALTYASDIDGVSIIMKSRKLISPAKLDFSGIKQLGSEYYIDINGGEDDVGGNTLFDDSIPKYIKAKQDSADNLLREISTIEQAPECKS